MFFIFFWNVEHLIEGSAHCQNNKGEVTPSTKIIVLIHGVCGLYCCLLRDLLCLSRCHAGILFFSMDSS